MKIYLIPIAAVLLSATACKKTTEEKMIEKQEVLQEPNNIAFNNNWTENIELNNGEKWQANAETTTQVAKMLNLLETTPTNTVEEYHDLASSLNLEKNILIKKCTMKDAAHNHLHTFLEPLMEKITALAEAESVEDAISIKRAIQENLDLYSTYFV